MMSAGHYEAPSTGVRGDRAFLYSFTVGMGGRPRGSWRVAGPLSILKGGPV